jgi:hypothetical protein
VTDDRLDAWEPSPLFDLVKELNAHAGRLAALSGVLIAATALSFADGPVHDAIANGTVDRFWLAYTALLALGVNNCSD